MPTRKDEALGHGVLLDDRRLQWGRVVADAEGWPIVRFSLFPSELQWGRVVADAEGSRRCWG